MAVIVDMVAFSPTIRDIWTVKSGVNEQTPGPVYIRIAIPSINLKTENLKQ